MKPVLLIVLCVILSISATARAQSGRHLFILSGQSNMAGLDPDQSFTPAVSAAFGPTNVIVVKEALGGQPISRWYKNWRPAKGKPPAVTGDLYDRLMAKVREAIDGQSIQSVTFVWMQGERDAREGHGTVYAASLRGLLAQLQADLQRRDLNFVVGRLSDFDLANAEYKHWTLVREALVAVAEADPYGRWVNTDDLNDGPVKQGKIVTNDLHCTPAGYNVLGQRFAEQAIDLIKQRSAASSAPASPAKE